MEDLSVNGKSQSAHALNRAEVLRSVIGGDEMLAGVGLHSLVNYSWQIALGDMPLTLEAFQALAKKGVPLA